ncbi:MAG: tetratricopeptide repeat protein [Paramuribaculum sp.]|nr:tetratricopeptide repeat protein [Paramuribaculum sp.]
MAKKNSNNETRTKIDDVHEALTGLEQKVENNKKIIVWVCTAIALIVALILIYVYLIRKPAIQKADDQLGQAFNEQMFVGDSTALLLYKDLAENGSHDGANLASLYAATILYKDGKYEEALKYLDDFSTSEKIISATSESLKGDCYVNLKQYDKALDCYEDAVDEADGNPYLTPIFLGKQANVQHELKNYAAEAKLYQQIKDDYSKEYLNTARYYNAGANPTLIPIDKYIERAKALAGENK